MSKETMVATLRAYATQVGAEDIGPEYVRTQVGPGRIELHGQVIGETTYRHSDDYSMRAVYTSLDGFGFKVGLKMPFHSLRGRIFGSKDVDMGDSELLREHFVIASDEDKVRQLFSRERLRVALSAAVRAHPELLYDFRDEQVKKTHSDALLHEVKPPPWHCSGGSGTKPDVRPETARLMHDFLTECLLTLEEIGSAAPLEST